MASWDVEYTNEFGTWWEALSMDEQRAITAAVELPERDGPTLGRPLVDTLVGSRHPNMKELRPPATFLRVLFAFDPRRTAILLIGGNKEHRWQEWYAEFMQSPTGSTTSTSLSCVAKEGLDEWAQAVSVPR